MENIRISEVEAKVGRVIIARILRDTDLVAGLIAICRKSNIITGAIQIAIGSLRKAEISWAMPSNETKRGSIRTDPFPIEGPLEFISGQGFVCRTWIDL